MAFPEKLPFTAWAVVLAAAFQAANSSTSFETASAWSLVILAAAGETALFYLKPVEWRKSRKWAIGSLATMTVAAVVVWQIVWPAYRKQFLIEDLSASLRIPDPSQLGGDSLDLNYLVLNKSAGSILIEEMFAVEIATTDFSINPARNAELCRIQGIYLGRAMYNSLAHPARKVVHVSMDRPSLPSLPSVEKLPGFEVEFQDDKKLDVATYDPKNSSGNGTDLPSTARSLEAGKAISVAATFDTDAAAWGNHNVMVACGAIKYLRSDGRAAWAVCPASIVAHVREKRTGSATLPSVTTTSFNERQCEIQRSP